MSSTMIDTVPPSSTPQPAIPQKLPPINPKTLEFLATVLLCSDKPFAIDTSHVDFNLVASRLGLKNKDSARVRFFQIKSQLLKYARDVSTTSAITVNSTATKSSSARVSIPKTPTNSRVRNNFKTNTDTKINRVTKSANTTPRKRKVAVSAVRTETADDGITGVGKVKMEEGLETGMSRGSASICDGDQEQQFVQVHTHMHTQMQQVPQAPVYIQTSSVQTPDGMMHDYNLYL